MANLKIKRVLTLPTVLEASSLYVVKPADGDIVTLVFTDNTAEASFRTLVKDDVSRDIASALSAITSAKKVVENSGSITLDPAESTSYIVELNSPGVAVSLPAVETDVSTMTVQFIQSEGISSVVSIPGAALPGDIDSVVAADLSSITICRLHTFNKGLTWFYERVGTYGLTPSKPLPELVGENAYTTMDATDLSKWVVTNGAVSTVGPAIRFTKGEAPTNGLCSLPVTMPVDKDFIFYGRVRMSNEINHSAGFWLKSASEDYLIFWLNYDPGASPSIRIGARATSGQGQTAPAFSQVIQDGDSLGWSSFAIQYCSKFKVTSVYLKQSDGYWKLITRVAGTQPVYNEMVAQTISAAPTGTWMEMETFMVCEPNIMAFGDSICAGSVGFNPDMALNRNNYESTWLRHARVYPFIKNNLIVNKGVGGTSSTEIKDSVDAELMDHSPKIVFVHASTNDISKNVDEPTRTTNITNTITKAHNKGAKVVLLNAMYGTADNSYNPGMKDYYSSWWDTHSETVGADTVIDIMDPIKSGGYMATQYTDPDKIHPTVVGYSKIGKLIAS